ncbi:MOSC domain-containing protein [Desulfovibrio ferrophilus]|uniref:MOSC domain protein n=1 Tax=Desulfovibrio ferrophilus TaxID=241368 RepID=A0A2Z6AXH4_9BACT|nr:MOSC domain-containing protein [Desulfovibrio ferrophilus]BBD07962.1 MOSC domain protein [Desulfovibrio ferrophilus]
MGTIHAVCTSTVKHQKKETVDKALLQAGIGMVGDAHAGSERQVSLLALEGIQRMQEKMPELVPGDFAENLTTTGLPLELLKVGTKLRIGPDIRLEITQIGKKCHSKCNIHKTVGYCIMPNEGIFAKVVVGGMVKPGDSVDITGS